MFHRRRRPRRRPATRRQRPPTPGRVGAPMRPKTNVPSFSSFDPGYMAFEAMGSSKNGGKTFLVTANDNQPHGDSPALAAVRQLGIETTNFVAQPKIGDNGDTIVSTGDALHILSPDFSQDNKLQSQELNYIGLAPAISDGSDPWVAFAAHSTKLGDGIFAAHASNPSQWYKIAGVADDGNLDPNEVWIDKDQNDQISKGEDKSCAHRHRS